jgi:hypothetical protein
MVLIRCYYHTTMAIKVVFWCTNFFQSLIIWAIFHPLTCENLVTWQSHECSRAMTPESIVWNYVGHSLHRRPSLHISTLFVSELYGFMSRCFHLEISVWCRFLQWLEIWGHLQFGVLTISFVCRFVLQLLYCKHELQGVELVGSVKL